MSELPRIPIQLRVHLAHAVVQAIADDAHVDILHIKGPAAEAVRGDRHSTDADVLVRPEQAERFFEALSEHGWGEVTRLVSGGLFEHSANCYHPQLGQLDVHVRFPGILIPAPDAFAAMWQEQDEVQIAHVTCSVPSLTHHRLLLLMHAARNLGDRDEEAQNLWSALTPEDQGEVWGSARLLKAEVALAAAVGGLDEFKDRPDYTFWAMSSAQIDTPPGPIRFIAKLRAAPSSAPHRLRGVIGYIRYVADLAQEGASTEPGRAPTLRARAEGLVAWVRNWLKPGPRRQV